MFRSGLDVKESLDWVLILRASVMGERIEIYAFPECYSALEFISALDRVLILPIVVVTMTRSCVIKIRKWNGQRSFAARLTTTKIGTHPPIADLAQGAVIASM
jgi:hypothetical protein